MRSATVNKRTRTDRKMGNGQAVANRASRAVPHPRHTKNMVHDERRRRRCHCRHHQEHSVSSRRNGNDDSTTKRYTACRRIDFSQVCDGETAQACMPNSTACSMTIKRKMNWQHVTLKSCYDECQTDYPHKTQDFMKGRLVDRIRAFVTNAENISAENGMKTFYHS